MVASEEEAFVLFSSPTDALSACERRQRPPPDQAPPGAPSSSKMYLRSLRYQLERKRAAKGQEGVASVPSGGLGQPRISNLETSYALQRENATESADVASHDTEHKQKRTERKLFGLSQKREAQLSRDQKKNITSATTITDGSRKARKPSHHLTTDSSHVEFDRRPALGTPPKAKENARPGSFDRRVAPMPPVHTEAGPSSLRPSLFPLPPMVSPSRPPLGAAEKTCKDRPRRMAALPPPIPLHRYQSSSPSPRASVLLEDQPPPGYVGDLKMSDILFHRSRSASPRPRIRDQDPRNLQKSRQGNQERNVTMQRKSRSEVRLEAATDVHLDSGSRVERYARPDTARPSVKVVREESPSRSHSQLPPISPVGRSPLSYKATESPRQAFKLEPDRPVTEPGHHGTTQSARHSSLDLAPPSPRVLAKSVRSLGAATIAQCLVPVLLEDVANMSCLDRSLSAQSRLDDARRTRNGAPRYDRMEYTAPAPFFLPKSSPLPPTPPTMRCGQSRGDRNALFEGEDCATERLSRSHRAVAFWARKCPSSSSSSASSSCDSPSPIEHSRERAARTCEELIRLKHELHRKKATQDRRLKQGVIKDVGEDEGSGLKAAENLRGSAPRDYFELKRLEMLKLHGIGFEKRVRFSRPLVTLIRHRPFTAAEDIDKLYFGEDELDELVSDRATVEGDQFELSLVPEEKGMAHMDSAASARFGTARSPDSDAAAISVTYTNRKLRRHRLGEGGDEVPFSPSDDTSSVFYE